MYLFEMYSAHSYYYFIQHIIYLEQLKWLVIDYYS